MKPQSVAAVKMPTVVRIAPTMVTNMTGFFTIRRGSSFLNASPIAGPTIFESNNDADFWDMAGKELGTIGTLEIEDRRV
jgi:hypothetical protein